MLRISLVENGNGPDCLRLEGRAVGAWVAEIQAQCETRLKREALFCLDLSEVTYVDREGVALFLNLKSRGVALHGCSPFLEEELKMGLENSDAV
jgi:ABC-type transporter Mla MlaB component